MYLSRLIAIMLLCFAWMPAFAAKPLRESPVSKLPQWHDFSLRQQDAIAALEVCEQNERACRSADVARWAKLIDDLKTQNRLRQIITVNRWFNRLPYKHDEYAYNTLDYWADTAALLERRGDCEDYALAKYYTLRQLGFSPEELKVAVVYDSEEYLNHAVLMVYVGGTRYMLDINGDDTDPSPMTYRYKTLYTFNENKAWFY